MDSDSSQYKAANSHLKDLNKNISGLNRLRIQMKLEQKIKAQTEMIERLRFVSDSMHKAGASKQSIRLALRGMYEYLKVTYGQNLRNQPKKSSKTLILFMMHKAIKPLSLFSHMLNHNKSIGYGTNVYH